MTTYFEPKPKRQDRGVIGGAPGDGGAARPPAGGTRSQPSPVVTSQDHSMNWFAPLHTQHFGAQANAIGAVNDAMSKAASQWSDAAQLNASRQHAQSLQDSALRAGLQMKQMDMARDAQKYNLLGGLLRSLRGGGGIRSDGRGNVSFT